jgi:hypothetical protein
VAIASESRRAASACTTTSASTNQRTSPIATLAAALRAPPGPSRPPDDIGTMPRRLATPTVSSVEPSSTTISSAISPASRIARSGGRLAGSTAAPLYTGMMTLMRALLGAVACTEPASSGRVDTIGSEASC